MAYQGLGLGLRLRSAACAEPLWGSRPPLNKRKKRRRRCATALRDVRRRDGRNAQIAAIRPTRGERVTSTLCRLTRSAF